GKGKRQEEHPPDRARSGVEAQTDNEEQRRQDNQVVSQVKLYIGKARKLLPEVGGQHRLERAAEAPEVCDLDQQQLPPEEGRGGGEAANIAELDREAGCGRPGVIPQDVRLPAQ